MSIHTFIGGMLLHTNAHTTIRKFAKQMPLIIHYLNSTAGSVTASQALPALSQQAVGFLLNLRLNTDYILHTVSIVGTTYMNTIYAYAGICYMDNKHSSCWQGYHSSIPLPIAEAFIHLLASIERLSAP